MILNVSGRTDIVAFYIDWFFKRLEEGFVDVRNPFNKHLISRIFFEDVDLILFCTKNPIPIVDKIQDIKIPILFHTTITPYKKNIEPNVPDKKEVIESVRKLSNILGADNVVVRYDPIFLSEEYTIDYHIRAFTKLCSELKGSVKTIIVSFIDDYKNVRRNEHILKRREFTTDDYEKIGKSFSKISSANGIKVQTCAEKNNLVEFGFAKGECLSQELASKLTGKEKFKRWKARNNENCQCVEMVDIGFYNSCKHFCKYCYANYDEKQVMEHYGEHNPNSSLLIGKIEEEDVIKPRKK